MPVISPEKLISLQHSSVDIRNVRLQAIDNSRYHTDQHRSVFLHTSSVVYLLIQYVSDSLRIMAKHLSRMGLLPPMASFLPSSLERSATSIPGQMSNSGVSLWSHQPFLSTSQCRGASSPKAHQSRKNT